MPYKKLEDANIKKVSGVSLTLAQANKIAEMADAITGVDNPWAVAIAQFKRGHKKTDSGWVAKTKSLGEVFELIQFMHLAGRHDQKRHAWRYGKGTAGVKQSLRDRSRAEREEYKRRARERGMGAGVEHSTIKLERARANLAKEKHALFKEEKRLRRIQKGAIKRHDKLQAAFAKRSKVWADADEAQKKMSEASEELRSYNWNEVPSAVQKRYDRAMDRRNKTYEKAVAHNDTLSKAQAELTAYGEKNKMPIDQFGGVNVYKIPEIIDANRKAFAEKTQASREVIFAHNLRQAEQTRQKLVKLPDKRTAERNKLTEELDDVEFERVKVKRYADITVLKDGEGKTVGVAPGWEDLNIQYTDQLIKLDQKRLELNGKIRELRKPSLEERKLVHVENPANPNYNIQAELTKLQEISWKAGMAETNRMVGTGMLDGVDINSVLISQGENYKKGDSTRASHFGYQVGVSSEVSMGDWDMSGTMAHELGHAVETHDPYVSHKAHEFLNRRTAGEIAQPLSELTGNSAYRDNEVAKPDKFKNAYMGKIYGRGASEITSMGIQEFYENPAKFAKEDPEYFNFIWAILRE